MYYRDPVKCRHANDRAKSYVSAVVSIHMYTPLFTGNNEVCSIRALLLLGLPS